MQWAEEYSTKISDIRVSGFSASDTDARQYLSSRVSTKIAESDGSEQLREHLAELKTTGFDTDVLFAQIESLPQPKDWEVGETFAETILEDEHEAMFPWATGWDKRTPRASLPGADIVGFQNKSSPRFIFGQVKSSSEKRIPPQVVQSGKDCLKEQMHCLRHQKSERQQLVQWLLPRVKGTAWESVFNEALGRYTSNNYYLVGLLISGGRDADSTDLTGICPDIQHSTGDGEVSLLGYYLPFEKDKGLS
jgi:hypothetical protein